MFGNRKLIKNILLTLGLSLIASFVFPVGVYQAKLRIEPNSGDFIQNCEYTLTLKMDTESDLTTSVDAKLFLSGFKFLNILAGDMDSESSLTGIAANGIHAGEEYLYINSYQAGPALSGSDLTIAELQFMTQTGLQNMSGFLDFYFLSSGLNSDDSTISRGENGTTNNYTNYKDILYLVEGGTYNLITGDSCELPPVVISGFYYQDTMIDSGIDYSVLGTKITAGPQITQTTGREIWTNTAVTLIITGDKNLHIVESSLAGLPVYVVDNNPETITKTLIITGNTGPSVLHYDYSGAVGSGYLYDLGGSFDSGTFYIDVFWIDQQLPVITGLITYNPNTIDVVLSGYLGGASWTSKDDEYKILAFSGINPAPTDYLSGGNTGNNLFSLIHTISFSGSWSGDVIYIDRAGNTGFIFLDLIDMNEYLLKAHPASRLITASTPNPNLASIYSVIIYSQTGLLITTGTVETNNYGTGVFETYETLSGYYQVKIRGLAHLQTTLSGVLLNNNQRLIDATSGAVTRFNNPIKDDLLDYYLYYNQIGGGIFSNNLDVYALYSDDFMIWDAYSFLSANASGSENTSGVLRTGLSSNIGGTGMLYYQTLLKNTSINNFEIDPNYQFYSGTENISNSGIFNFSTGVDILSVEIPGELVVDGEINGVDSSVIIQYIRDNGVMNTNTIFGLVAEDLNANGQVDAADITVHGYNLYRVSLY